MTQKAKFEVGQIVAIDWGNKMKEFHRVESVDFMRDGETRYSLVGQTALHPVESMLREPTASEKKLLEKRVRP
jgi:hypothetical protein